MGSRELLIREPSWQRCPRGFSQVTDLLPETGGGWWPNASWQSAGLGAHGPGMLAWVYSVRWEDLPPGCALARTRHLASPRPREHWPAGGGRFRDAVVDRMTGCCHWDDRITGCTAATKRR